MCGIAGAAGRGGWSPETAARVQERLRHRGPEGEGAWSEGDASLVHTRLKVIDLSEAGAQPMWTDDGRLGLVYNGEVYNYRALRDRLRDRGHEFRSATDTEVVLEAWAEWGEGCLERLEGIFAFGLWDRERRRLWLARDRTGVKPLYWTRAADGRIAFASEIRGLLAAGAAAASLDRAALPRFLLQGTVATPRTLVRGIEMLPAGCRLSVEVRDGRASEPAVARYADPYGAGARAGGAPVSAADARRELVDRLREAMDRQRVADVPLGAFLSGGLDSTAVVALLSEVADGPISTFTVASEEAGYADRDHARLVAERFGTDHREVELSDRELAARVPDALAAQDHPTVDGVNTYLVAGAAREAGLTVALSGLGGDELFGGYPTFGRLRLLGRVRGLLRATPGPVRGGLAGLVRRLGRGVASQKVADLLETDGGVARSYPVLRSVFPPSRVEALVGTDGFPGRGEPGADGPAAPAPAGGWEAKLVRAFAERPGLSTMERAALAESACYMHDVLLRDTDQMSMAHSLEVRVPLLDDAVVEHVRGLPARLRFPRGGASKALLSEALAERIPAEVRERPKRGFALPFDRWMRGPLRGLCEEGLAAAAAHPALAAGAVEEAWRSWLEGEPGAPWHRPWLLTALGRWMEREGVS